MQTTIVDTRLYLFYFLCCYGMYSFIDDSVLVIKTVLLPYVSCKLRSSAAKESDVYHRRRSHFPMAKN
jgi:hypothetical protein